MSDSYEQTVSESSEQPEDYDSAQSDAPQPAPPGGHRRSESSRLWPVLTIVALVVALAAGGVATWTLLRPPSAPKAIDTTTPQYTDAQRAAAKDQACKTYDVVWKGITLNANRPAPDNGPNDATVLAVAANGRLSLYDGGQYLLTRLDPATPPDLADAIRKFGNKLMDIGAWATAGMADNAPDQAAREQEADALNTGVYKLCNPQ